MNFSTFFIFLSVAILFVITGSQFQVEAHPHHHHKDHRKDHKKIKGATCCGSITIQSGDTCSALLSPCQGVTKYIECPNGKGCGSGLSNSLDAGAQCTMHC